MAAPERRKLDDLRPHPRLGTTELLPALSEDEYAALRDSIASAGLLQPIVIDPDNVIIDGHHRWRAARDAGYTEVPVMVERHLSDDARLSLGITLNVARRQLSTGQKREAIATLLVEDAGRSDRSVAGVLGVSPTTVGDVRADLEAAGLVSKMDTRTGSDGVPQPATKPAPTGRRTDAAPKRKRSETRDVGESVESSETETESNEAGARTGAASAGSPIPLAFRTWTQERAIEARGIIASLPASDRRRAIDLVEQPGIPDRLGLKMLKNVAEADAEERERLLSLHDSDDPRDQSLAKTEAVGQPPNGDPRCTILDEARLTARRAIKLCDRDPGGSFRERIEKVVADLHTLSEDIHAATRSGAA